MVGLPNLPSLDLSALIFGRALGEAAPGSLLAAARTQVGGWDDREYRVET
jgi:hypothetical protein